MPTLLLQGLTGFILLELCNVHTCSHPLDKTRANNTSSRRKTLILLFEWRGIGAHCDALEMSQWTNHGTLVMSVTIVQSFSSVQKKSSETFHFFVVLNNLVSTM